MKGDSVGSDSVDVSSSAFLCLLVPRTFAVIGKYNILLKKENLCICINVHDHLAYLALQGWLVMPVYY